MSESEYQRRWRLYWKWREGFTERHFGIFRRRRCARGLGWPL
jgi:hypothetical protein